MLLSLKDAEVMMNAMHFCRFLCCSADIHFLYWLCPILLGALCVVLKFLKEIAVNVVPVRTVH